MIAHLLSSVNRHLVRCKELAPGGRAVLLGEQGQKGVADFELFDHGAEADAIVSETSWKNIQDTTYP